MIHLPDASQTAHQACEQHCSGLDSGVHGYTFVGDNIDETIRPRLQQQEKGAVSLHYRDLLSEIGWIFHNFQTYVQLLTQLCSFHPRFVTILKHQVTSHIRSSHSVEIASKSKVVGLIMIAHTLKVPLGVKTKWPRF